MQANVGDDRVVLPLLRCIHVLFQKGVLGTAEIESPGQEENLSFGDEVLDCVKVEMQGCRDVKKLLACLSVTIHLLESGDEGVRRGALAALMVLLGHRFPRVRKATAEQLYLKLLESETLPLPSTGGEEEAAAAQDLILEKLSTVVWDGERLSHLRAERDLICERLGLSTPKGSQGDSSARKCRRQQEQENRGSKENRREDELESYGSLVKEAGY